jgi:hypothetical protein
VSCGINHQIGVKTSPEEIYKALTEAPARHRDNSKNSRHCLENWGRARSRGISRRCLGN